MSSTNSVKGLAVLSALILAAIGIFYYLISHNNYDQALRETSTRINSLASVELNIDGAGDITYSDLEKKVEQYISETETIYAKVGKAGGDNGGGKEGVAREYLAASLKFQRAMKLRYHSFVKYATLSKEAKEAAMRAPHYTGGNPIAALNSLGASIGPIEKLISEASEAEGKAANAKQAFFEATALLISATQKAKSITSHDNLANLSLLEKINSRPE